MKKQTSSRNIGVFLYTKNMYEYRGIRSGWNNYPDTGNQATYPEISGKAKGGYPVQIIIR
jgi:hypothetical protein